MSHSEFEGKSHYDGQNPGHLPNPGALGATREIYDGPARTDLPVRYFPVDGGSEPIPSGDLRVPAATEARHRHFSRRSEEVFYTDDVPVITPSVEIKG